MFENNKENGLFGDLGGFGGFDDLDLGSDAGFTGLGPMDDAEANALFGNSNSADESETRPKDIGDTPVTTAEPEKKEESVTKISNDVKTESEITEADFDEKKADVQTNETVSDKILSNPVSDTPDLFEAAVAKAEEKQAENEKSKLAEKPPIFSYANATEEIVDTSKTFDHLRNEKAEDFPELDDGTSVTWKMTYGSVIKTVSNPKKTTIASLKKEIENSKAFTDGLKKAKGETECKVTPTVVAKKKGIMPTYKGVYNSLTEAVSSGKTIAFVPSGDGNIYEVRNNRIGTFIAKTDNVSVLEQVKSGFISALPKIPYELLEQVIVFFKSFVKIQSSLEALVYIYWSFADSRYYVYVPKQTVSKVSVDTTLPDIEGDDFVLVMEIHSHNTMPAVFSPTDDKDERATRLYTIIGRLDKVYPDITTRISVGGKYIQVDPEEVFEGITGSFPEQWKSAVKDSSQKEDVQ